jgi:hypothetical protein
MHSIPFMVSIFGVKILQVQLHLVAAIGYERIQLTRRQDARIQILTAYFP